MSDVPSPASPLRSKSGRNVAASAISEHFDTRTAAMEVADQLLDCVGSDPDLVVLFSSFHHRAAFGDAAEWIRNSMNPRCLLGVTGESVLGGDHELEGRAGLSALALRCEGMTLHPWASTSSDPLPLDDPAALRERVRIDDSSAGAIMLADPFAVPIVRLVEAISTGRRNSPLPLTGGIASAGTQPGLNIVVLNEQAMPAGAVGVTIGGAAQMDFVVSQGCRPIGRPLVVTKVHQNMILELGSRNAIEVLKELAESLPEQERHLLHRGLLVGTVIDEYKERFGRGDFLVRNIIGFDQRAGGIGVGDLPRVGQTIQFHVRDAATATEDLQLLLDAQQLSEPPFAALLFTCNGRGERLFEQANHDLGLVHDRLGNVPVAGFFAAGEIGPIAGRSFLHGHTASLTLFRAKQ